MQTKMKFVASIKFSSAKNCIGIITSPLLYESYLSTAGGLHVLQVSSQTVSAFFSVHFNPAQGDSRKSELMINGLYAFKLGFLDGMEVLIELADNITACSSAAIEPLSIDDWEILQLHSGEVEMNLLDQLRVIWPGQVFPLWVDRNVCIFMRTKNVEPSGNCSVLVPLTELIVMPKTNESIISDKAKVQDTNLQTQKSDDTTVDVENAISTLDQQSQIKKDSALSWMYCKLKQFIIIMKFILLVMWRQIPRSFHYLYKLLFPSIQHVTWSDTTQDSRNEALAKCISNVPDDFDVVLRVEPQTLEQSQSDTTQSCLYNQPNSVFLHSKRNSSNSNADIFLVKLSKILSPTEKNIEKSSKKSTLLKSKSGKPSPSAETPFGGGNSTQCVVRMYLHSFNKYAMVCDWNTMCSGLYLKVPSCVRRQLNLSVSSKVRLQKLSSSPQFSSDITVMSMDILPSAQPFPETVTFKQISQSFQEWITYVSDVENPIPISVGTLLVFPLVSNEKSMTEDHFPIVIEAIVSAIKSKKKVSDDSSKKLLCNTYLLYADDLQHIELNISQSNNARNSIPSPSDVDLIIPVESALVYCNGHEEVMRGFEHYIELALACRPLSNKLSVKGRNLRPSCLLVSGGVGTGKTVLSRSILHKYASDHNLHAYVHSVSCGQWRGKKPENVKQLCKDLLHELLWRQPSILLLDDLDELIPSPGGTGEDSAPDGLYTLQLVSVIKRFLLALTGETSSGWCATPRVAVIITCMSINTLHSSMTCSGTHLFNRSLNVELPNSQKRKVILKSIIENFTDYVCPDDIAVIVDKTEGFAAGDLMAVVRRSAHLIQQKKFALNLGSISLHSQDDTLTTSILDEALLKYTPASLQNARLHKPSPLTWHHVGGLKTVREKLTEQLVWPVKYRHLFSQCGLQTQSGVLLFGPPGCGKTLIAGVVANECGLNFISIKGPEILSKYIGASEAAVRDLFSRARAAAPCVLFFDEFDSLAPKRGHDSTGVTDRVVNQLLTHLDGVEPLEGVTVLAASSRPDLLDPALLRPGRLDNLLYCPFPDLQERYEILRSLSKKLHLEQSINLLELAEKCDNFSGADLKALLYNAQLETVHETVGFHLPVSCPSMSRSSSEVTLENEDLYQSNGYSSVDEDQDGALSMSPRSVEKLQNTAASLIKSIQKIKSQSCDDDIVEFTHSKHIYQSSFHGGNSTRVPNEIADFNNSEKIEQSAAVYFPSLHHGRSETLPNEVTQVAETVYESFSNTQSQPTFNQFESSHVDLVIKKKHIDAALSTTRPSVSANERVKLSSMYSNFIRTRAHSDSSQKNYYEGELRATLS